MLESLVAERIDSERVRPRTAPASHASERAVLFQELVDAELDRAYRLAAVILRDPAEAEDAVHDAAETAWRRWADLRDVDRAVPWFRRIVVNGCRDRLRRRRRWSLLEVIRRPRLEEHPQAADSTEASADRDLLRRALDRLSPDERVTIGLRYEEDMSVLGIAALLAIPEGTVKSRLHNALRKLRVVVAEEER